MNDTISNTQALPPGTRLEEFVIERVLGSGGFGITYLARDTRLNRPVVIKENLPVQFCFRDTHSLTVAPRHTQGDDADNFRWSLDNFSREAAMLASLDHPGIVKVLRSFEAFGTAYFVMPFVEGLALDEIAKDRDDKPFTEEELRGLLERLLGALEYLHARGIYHRDIKPGNILITNEGVPVLIDFGSARQRLSERSMTVVESPGYTPFEQLQTRGNVGPWSDLYALGATLVKLMSGEAPPKTNDRTMGDPWQPLTGRAELSGKFSQGFLAGIDRALRLPIEERWQDAGEWMKELRACVVVKKSTSVAPRVEEQLVLAEFPGRKVKLPLWIIAPCVFLGMCAVIIIRISNKEPAPSNDTAVNEAAIQSEHEEAEATAAQARVAEQRAAQAEQEKQYLIAQAKAKVEAAVKEAERQLAERTEQERQAKIAQEKARQEAGAKEMEKQRAARVEREKQEPATEISAMQKSIRDGKIKEFTIDQVLGWKAGENETVDGQVFQTGVVSYKADTIFGVKTITAKAFIQNGKVLRWIWPKSGMEIK